MGEVMNIRELAKEAGFDWHTGWTLEDDAPNRFETFAKMVAAHEREECAKACEEVGQWPSLGPKDCAYAIRERGTT
jgi:hypothetical protein